MQSFCNTKGCEKKSELKACSKCHTAAYCSRDHQVADWAAHKLVCDEIADAQKQGFVKKVIEEGNGGKTPKRGQSVTVHYTGRLLNGTVFDSSEERNEPFKFAIGKKEVIRAWDEGVATMKKGEKATLFCSPAYAYGNSSVAQIPANSVLVFTVTLLDFAY